MNCYSKLSIANSKLVIKLDLFAVFYVIYPRIGVGPQMMEYYLENLF